MIILNSIDFTLTEFNGFTVEKLKTIYLLSKNDEK